MSINTDGQTGVSDTSASAASAVVRSYLNAMEARDLVKAKSLLSENFHMTFPGGVVFNALEELVEWGSSRYRFVNKTYEIFDQTADGDDVIVYCFGTLAGQWPDGRAFDNVRFIDRFRVSCNKLIDQQVWNDLAENMNSEALKLPA